MDLLVNGMFGILYKKAIGSIDDMSVVMEGNPCCMAS